MKRIIFTPILKTKRTSEYNALKEMGSLIGSCSNIYPYIECIKSITNKDVIKYINLLEGNCFFLEPLEEDIPDVEMNIDTFGSNCSICYRVNKATTQRELETFININRRHNKTFGIKIDDADERFLPLLKTLEKNEFLFIELDGTSYFSSSFLEDLLFEGFACQIIIHSNERNQQLKGGDFADYDFNGTRRFNFSIVDAIKNRLFGFDGFGSRCTAKNDNTEDVKRIAKSVFGVFIIYDFNKNEFFSVKSKEQQHISIVYRNVRDIINTNRVDLDSRFFNNTKTTKDVLDKYMGGPTFSSSKAITISIVRYIEEIYNNLF